MAATLMGASAGIAEASFTIEPGSPFAVGVDPFGVVASDFNGDARPDVAVVNGTSSNVTTLLRQPADGFGAEVGSPTPVGAGPSGATVADFNGDARPDLAVANFTGPGSVSALLRQPGGGWTNDLGSPVVIGDRASAISSADFNGDTRPDLAVTGWDTNTVRVLLRQPGGGFAPEPGPASTQTHPRALATADFNADSRPDLAVANEDSSSVSVMLREAAGGFAPEAGSPVAVGAQPFGVTSADFNADGRPDLAVASLGPDTLTVLLRQPGGGFAPDAGSPIAVGANPVAVSAGDFNGDGLPDLAVANNGAGTVTVLLRQAGGGFAPDPSSPVPAPAAGGLAVADFNSDGRPDISVANQASSGLTSLLNTTPAADTTPPQTTILKGPKKKTAKRKAKLKFTSDEPATFECKLDKRPFGPCASPFKKKVKAGRKHRFAVRATDASGNTDPTPAKRKWKVLSK